MISRHCCFFFLFGHSTDYDARFHVLWVDATDAVTTEQSYQQIAIALFGADAKGDLVRDVVLWLQKSEEEWLLVFDNAPVSGLAKYLPDGDRGNILYTSRHRNLQPRLRPECVASIEEMDAPEAILLLLRSAQEPVDIAEKRELARSIVTALGLLPLAIDQAGAYIHMAPCPLDKYLGVFNEQKEVLLRSPRFKGSDERRHIAVYATFNISYRAIKAFADKKEDLARAKDAEIALKILNLICFYHNEGFVGAIFNQAAINRYRTQRFIHIPLKAGEVELESLIRTYETEITPDEPEGRGWDSDTSLGGINFLHEFSLLKFDISTSYTNMHILVHDWARDRLDSKEKSDWGLAARSLLMDSIRLAGGVRGAVYRRETTTHLEACLKHVTAEQDDIALESEHLAKVAKVFQQASKLDAAEAALTKALQYRTVYFGLLDPAPFIAMSQLARLYEDQGKYWKAEEMLLEVIDRRKLYYKEEKWQAALDRHKTIADGEAHPEPELDEDEPLDDKSLRDDVFVLGRILVLEDSRLAAADVYEEILGWNERKHGEHSPEARKYRRKVNRLRGIGDSDDEAELTIQDAQEAYDQVTARLGTNHFSAIAAQRRLARVLVKNGALREAQDHLWHVYQWSETLYGENSLPNADAAISVGELLQKRSMLFDAINMYEHACITYRMKLGDHHPKSLGCLKNLAVAVAALPEYESAIKIMEICRAGLVETLGEDHRLTRLSANLLRQFQYFEETVPDYIRITVANKTIADNRDAWGEDAPLWMQEWEPQPVEPIIQERLDRGEAVYSYRVERVDVEGSSFPLYKMVADQEMTREQGITMSLTWDD